MLVSVNRQRLYRKIYFKKGCDKILCSNECRCIVIEIKNGTSGINPNYQSIGMADANGNELATTGDLTTTGVKTINISTISGKYRAGVWMSSGASMQIGDMILRK